MKLKKIISVFTVLLLIMLIPAVAFAASAPERLQGQDRYETAISVAKAGWPSGADNAILAYGENYPDALCAGPLAGVLNAPILLTDKGSLDSGTEAELKALNVKNVYIVGGTGVVSSGIESYIRTMGMTCERINGQDRYGTSIKIAEKVWSIVQSSRKVFVVNGEDYSDAVSVSPIATYSAMPIILAYPDKYDPYDNYIKAFSSSQYVTKAYIVGSSDSVREEIANIFPQKQRIYGDDKYWRNTGVIQTFLNDADIQHLSFDKVFLATGENFPDALAGSVLAARTKSPIFLVNKSLSGSASDLLKSNLIENSKIEVLGGTGAVSDYVLSQVTALIPQKPAVPVIVSVSDVTAAVNQGDTYSLPVTISASMSDGSTKSVSVAWKPASANTSAEGTYTFEGTVQGYSGKVKLTLEVVPAGDFEVIDIE